MAHIFTEIGQVALTSIFSLAMMFLITRWGGKRQIAQMSPFDYLNAVTVGSIAAEMATNLETWYRPFTALLVYGTVTWLVEVSACKSVTLRTFWSGRSIILMKNGVILKENLRKATIDLNEFLGQARIAGYFDPNEIETAILENNGQISFLPKSEKRPITPQDMKIQVEPVSAWYDLILDGRIMEDNLKESGYDLQWLDHKLHGYGIGQRQEAFYAACDKQGRFFACRAH